MYTLPHLKWDTLFYYLDKNCRNVICCGLEGIFVIVLRNRKLLGTEGVWWDIPRPQPPSSLECYSPWKGKQKSIFSLLPLSQVCMKMTPGKRWFLLEWVSSEWHQYQYHHIIWAYLVGLSKGSGKDSWLVKIYVLSTEDWWIKAHWQACSSGSL